MVHLNLFKVASDRVFLPLLLRGGGGGVDELNTFFELMKTPKKEFFVGTTFLHGKI